MRMWSRTREFLSNLDGPALLGTGTYREVLELLHGAADYRKLVLWGTDLRNGYSRVVVQPGVSPVRIDFLSAWGPVNLGSIYAPEGLEVLVWARGDQVRALEFVLNDRSLQIDGQGSVLTSGID
ncbi:MAG: hypothetical protein R8J94_20770 [Acidimicrobiia bacterium]|nr:hypothetical protein [Acidimicrobiia bacterium]